MELKTVIGSILGSVAEARSLSDRVSRDLAVLYEKDALMRAFPVPRIEIDTIDFDLKFVLQGDVNRMLTAAEPNPVRDLVKLTASRVRGVVTTAIPERKLTNQLTFPRTKDYEQIGTVAEETTIDLILGPTELAAHTPPDDKVQMQTFDVKECAHRIVQALADRGLATVKSESVTERLAELLEPIRKQHEEEVAALRLIEIPLPTETRMTALFAYKDLVELPPEVLSTMKMTVNVRNYEWTQVGEQEGEPLRKLVPQ